MNSAPVVLFTYKRLSITRLVIQSLLENPGCASSRLIVYSDGPRGPGDEAEVNKVRDYLRKLSGFTDIEFRFREQNLGLAQSFIQGITEVLAEHERAIFLEDDNLVSPHFLDFMNTALARYENEQRVACITAYSFPLWPAPRTPYFIRGADTWSMATWRKGWKHFNPDGSSLLSEINRRRLRSRFSRDGLGFYSMLEEQIKGEIDSWGVRWWASAFVDDLYCLYPAEPLCVSIGYGEDSVHCEQYSPVFRGPSDLADRPVTNFPSRVRQTNLNILLLRLMNFRIRWLGRFQRLLRVAQKPPALPTLRGTR